MQTHFSKKLLLYLTLPNSLKVKIYKTPFAFHVFERKNVKRKYMDLQGPDILFGQRRQERNSDGVLSKS
jgi:hypothetical protein